MTSPEGPDARTTTAGEPPRRPDAGADSATRPPQGPPVQAAAPAPAPSWRTEPPAAPPSSSPPPSAPASAAGTSGRGAHGPGSEPARPASGGYAPSGAGSPVPPVPARPPVPRPTTGEGPTTVLPDSGVRRPAPPRATSAPVSRPAARPAGRSRKARLALKRIDPWSVFVFSLLASVFVGIALVVAVTVLYAVLSMLGVPDSLNELFAEVTGADVATDPLFTASRFVGGAAVLGAVNIVLLTLLATLGALLYNLVASFTGGIEVTLGEGEG